MMAAITGGTFFLNPLALDYPIMQWVESALSFCSEVILIDMGSKDGTRRALRKFGKKIRIINEPWQFSKTYHEGIPRNVILREASNPWVYLTDADEFLHENDIESFKALTNRTDYDLFKLSIRTFYGSCYVICNREKRFRFALIRKGVGFQFGPTKGKATHAADKLLLKGEPADKVARWLDVDIPLYDYGRCRPAKARLRSVDFFVKQDQARRGMKPIGMTSSTSDGMGNRIKDYVIPYPNFSSGLYEVWKGQHPKVALEWVRKHWRSHGWEI